MSKLLPRCVMRAKDGSQCSRRVSDGSNPPVCHIHSRQAQGNIAGIAQTAELDLIEIVEKLARSSTDQVKLRAVELLLELRKESEPKHEYDASWLAYADDAQREHLRDLINTINEIKADVRAYIAAGGTKRLAT